MKCKGNEIFSITAQFLKEIGAVVKNSQKNCLCNFALQRYNKGVPKLDTGGSKKVNEVDFGGNESVNRTTLELKVVGKPE